MSIKDNKNRLALTEVFSVAGIIALIAVFTIPAFNKVRARAQEQAIVRNLAIIVDMGQMCILENGLTESVTMSDFKGTYCPTLRSVAGESYEELVVNPEGGMLAVSVGTKTIEYRY